MCIRDIEFFFFFQAEDGIRDRSPSRGLGDVYKRQEEIFDNVEYAGEYAEGGYAAGIQKGKLDFHGITVYFEVKVKGVKNISIVSLPQYREFYGESVGQDVIANKADGLKLKVDFADGSSEIVKYKGEYNYGLSLIHI